MVTIENWEEYAILRADGELHAAGKAALEAFLAVHPELAEEAQMYDSLQLVPDETVVFAGKESLLKPEARVIQFDRRWVYGVAAGVALLIGSLAVLRTGVEGTGSASQLAGRAHVQIPITKTPAPQAATREEEMVAQQPTTESTSIAQTAPAPGRVRTPRAEVAPATAAPSPQNTNEESSIASEAITPLLSADARMLAIAPPAQRSVEAVAGPNDQSDAEDPILEASRNLLDRLPIDRSRFALVDDIRSTASSRVQSIRQTREKIRNTDVTIAVGRRDLFTLRF